MLILFASKLGINQVLLNIIEDIVKGVNEGFNGLNSFWQMFWILLDILSNVVHYTAARACFDLIGHTADTLCSICIIERRKGIQNREWSTRTVFTVDVCLL